MGKRSVPLTLAFPMLLLCMMGGPGGGSLRASTQSPMKDREDSLQAQRGLDLVMDGDPDSAIQVFRRIQADDPQSPLGYLLEAEALWWKIYFTTAKLLDPDVFDVASAEATPHDSHFNDLLNAAIVRSEARIRAQQDLARSVLYQGLAYALDARLAGLRGKDLSTGRAGKKMRVLLLRALKMDPNLADAYLGLGVYNYLLDTLPGTYKVFLILMALPGGSRAEGLQQLAQAAEKGELTRGEAKFYLAKNLSRTSEGKYAKSLELFQELARDFPHNPLWPLVVASLRCQLGQTREGKALYREVLEKTAGNRNETEQAVHRAARQALGEKSGN